jgi:hypothetical protein
MLTLKAEKEHVSMKCLQFHLFQIDYESKKFKAIFQAAAAFDDLFYSFWTWFLNR